MIYLEATINDSNQDILRTGNTGFPSLEYIGIGTHLGSCDMTIVVVMPLIVEQWIIERHGRCCLGSLGYSSWRNLQETLTANRLVKRNSLCVRYTFSRTEQVSCLCQFHT